MFKTMGLKGKVLSICLLLASIIFVAGTISFVTLRQVSSEYTHVTKINLPNSVQLAYMRGAFRNLRVHIRTLGLPEITREQGENAIRLAEQAIEIYEKADRTYNEIEFVPGEQELYEDVKREWQAFKNVAMDVIALDRRDTAADHARMQAIFMKDCPEGAARFEAAMAKLVEFQVRESDVWVTKAEQAATVGNLLMLITAIAGFGVALLVGYAFSGSLSKVLQSIAQSLSAGADEVASAATQVSSASDALSSSATEQAAALQQTASSIEEMTAMVKKNADNADKSSSLARGSEDSANTGKQVVTEMITAINEINTSNNDIMKQIEDSNREISEIVKVIAEIGNKTKVINDIVFQTKLLSFNASVEAARAGEHGKGFAVVAEEVGNLAQMSGNAAKEIASMLEGSIQKVENIVTATKSKVEKLVALGKSKVEAGTSVARRCGDVLDELVRNVASVNLMVGEISTASREQAQGVQEINKAMNQLDQVTEQNASASHQAASAADQLAKQAEVLRASVQNLIHAVNGHNTQSASQAGPASRAGKPAPESRVGKKIVDFAAARAELKKKATEPVPATPVAIKTETDSIPSETDARFSEV